jgi:hypothetical protein
MLGRCPVQRADCIAAPANIAGCGNCTILSMHQVSMRIELFWRRAMLRSLFVRARIKSALRPRLEARPAVLHWCHSGIDDMYSVIVSRSPALLEVRAWQQPRPAQHSGPQSEQHAQQLAAACSLHRHPWPVKSTALGQRLKAGTSSNCALLSSCYRRKSQGHRNGPIECCAGKHVLAVHGQQKLLLRNQKPTVLRSRVPERSFPPTGAALRAFGAETIRKAHG